MRDMSALHTAEKYKLFWNRLHIDPSRYESLRISLQLDSIVFTRGRRNLSYDSLAGMFVLVYCVQHQKIYNFTIFSIAVVGFHISVIAKGFGGTC